MLKPIEPQIYVATVRICWQLLQLDLATTALASTALLQRSFWLLTSRTDDNLNWRRHELFLHSSFKILFPASAQAIIIPCLRSAFLKLRT